MNMKFVIYYLLFAILVGCNAVEEKEPVDYVNPFIGTGGHGHTYPGAATPFGMVQLSPDTRKDNWDACGGYHYSDSITLGFSHTHLSGTGVGDYGDIRFSPIVFPEGITKEEIIKFDVKSSFSHHNEQASPGYYSTYLDDIQTKVELTATPRCGFHKYTFPAGVDAAVVIDLTEGVTSDKIIESWVSVINDSTIAGCKSSRGWAQEQTVWFRAEFSQPFKEYLIVSEGMPVNSPSFSTKDPLKIVLRFDPPEEKVIMSKVGISSVDRDGPMKNLQAEIPGFDFDMARNNARDSWNEMLSKIEVEGGSPEDKTVFYTALYHSFLAPNLFSDADGRYMGHDFKTHQVKGHKMYTVFSLWDTFRALHPLFTIVQQDLTNDLINSMLNIYDQGGLLPVWELAANETWCMIGYHSIPVIADAYMKGIREYNVEKAFEAMKKSAVQDHHGLRYYKQFGYIPADKEGESVSKTLEYAYDDWCIAMMAKDLGKEDDYKNYIQRAQYYKNIFDPETKFMRGKMNGMFVKPFNPTEVNFMLTEANTWQYTFFVPQDITGLMKLLGGRGDFTGKLDTLFNTNMELSGRHQSDITGLVGQYAHGNEPSHHMAYLYNFAGQPWKTQQIVRVIMGDLYGHEPDGLCGNEDCGQMSAWYVLSSMGFYPVTPGANEYVIGSPVFNKVTIHLENGKKFTIQANGNSEENIYIQSARMNGVEYSKSFFTHEDIMAGGELVFEMSDHQSETWGTGDGDMPATSINDHLITPVPYIIAESRSFTGKLDLALANIYPDAEIFYDYGTAKSLGGFEAYSRPLSITNNTWLRSYALKNECVVSPVISGEFNLMPQGRSIQIKHTYNSQYTAGGDHGLIDLLRGGENFRTGFWQGYHGVDLDAVIDLGAETSIEVISAGFLQDQRSWIFMPEHVEVSVSLDGDSYNSLGQIKNDVPQDQGGVIIREFEFKPPVDKVRYIKVFAKNIEKCPEWHLGSGNPSWIFIDEIVIKQD